MGFANYEERNWQAFEERFNFKNGLVDSCTSGEKEAENKKNFVNEK